MAKDAHAITAERCPGPSWACHTRRIRVPFDAAGGVVSVLSTTGGTLPAECRDRVLVLARRVLPAPLDLVGKDTETAVIDAVVHSLRPAKACSCSILRVSRTRHVLQRNLCGSGPRVWRWTAAASLASTGTPTTHPWWEPVQEGPHSA